MERQYFLHNGTQQFGPLTLEGIRAAALQGILHVWYEGLENWVPVDQVPELVGLVNQPPPTQAPPPPVAPEVSAPTEPGPEATSAPQQPAAPFSPDQEKDKRRRRNLANEIDSLYSNTLTYFVLCFVSFALTILLIAVFAIDENVGGAILTVIFGALATVAFAIVHIVNWCKLHYRYWLVVNERTGFREVSPDQAVGFLFIPFYNLYWRFRSYQKLSELLNAELRKDKYEGRGPRVDEGTTSAMCVLSIVTIVPYLGVLVALVNIFLWFNVYSMHRKAVTFMLRHPTA